MKMTGGVHLKYLWPRYLPKPRDFGVHASHRARLLSLAVNVTDTPPVISRQFFHVIKAVKTLKVFYL